MDIETEITERLLRTLLLTSKILDQTGDIQFPEFELTTTSYIILGYISEGTSTTKELAHKLQSTYPNITHKTKLLEEKGYIQRNIDPADKRSWNFCLTPNGEKALNTIRLRHSEFAKDLIGQFSEKEKQLIANFLKGIEQHIELIAQHGKLADSASANSGSHAHKSAGRKRK